MRARLALVLMLALTGSPAVGQVITDVVLPLGTPRFQGLVFSDDDALATISEPPGASIYRWTGLPNAPTLSVLPLGVLDLANSWYRLDDRTAAFDGANGTVTLVRGLPDLAVLVPTSLPAGSKLVAVNPTTAVRASASGFHVVRHADAGAAVTFVPSSESLIVGPRHEFAAVDADTLIGLSVGPDATVGTPDDRLVRVDGLEGPVGAITVTFAPRAAAWAPEGFVVTPRGSGVAWRSPGLSAFDLEVVRVGATVTSVTLSTTTPVVFGHVFNGSWPYGVRVVPPNSIVLDYDDDLGIGHALLRDLDGAPTTALSWYWSSQSYFGDELIDERTLVGYDFVSYQGFSYTRWSTDGSSVSRSVGEPCWNDLAFVAPNGVLLACFAQGSTCSGPGMGNAVLVLERQAPGGPDTHTLEWASESWARAAGAARPHVFALGSSQVAGFIDSAAPWATPELLRICSFGLASPHEAAGRIGGAGAVELTITPDVPSLSSSLTITSIAPGPVDPIGYLAVALQRTRPFELLPFDALAHIDPTALLALVPVPFTPGLGGSLGTLTIPGGLPPALGGLPLHAQMITSTPGTIALSDLAVFTYGL